MSVPPSQDDFHSDNQASPYLEYLSSGENLAGCADFVTTPSRTFFRVYTLFPDSSSVYIKCMLAVANGWRRTRRESDGLECFAS